MKRASSAAHLSQESIRKVDGFLTKAYAVFNVSPIIKKYDEFSRKEVAIEVPPEMQAKGRTGKP